MASPGSVLFMSLSCLSGVLVFTYYINTGCDPIRAGYINNPNQIIPYFVMDAFNVPVITGLFLSALAAASLSTASSNLNAAATCAWKDLGQDILPHVLDETAAFITKIIVVFCGVFATLMSYGIAMIGGVLTQITGTFSGAVNGPAAGIYLIGAFLPWVTWQGALIGGLTGTAFGTWISIGSYSIKSHWTMLPTTVANCSSIVTNVTMATALETSTMDMITTTAGPEGPQGLEKLYSLSFMWIREAVTGVTVFVAVIVSLLQGCRDPKTVPPRLVHPVIRKLLKLKCDDQENSKNLPLELTKKGDLYTHKENEYEKSLENTDDHTHRNCQDTYIKPKDDKNINSSEKDSFLG